MLSIPKMQNLERNIEEFERGSDLIISCSLKHIEKKKRWIAGYTYYMGLEF